MFSTPGSRAGRHRPINIPAGEELLLYAPRMSAGSGGFVVPFTAFSAAGYNDIMVRLSNYQSAYAGESGVYAYISCDGTTYPTGGVRRTYYYRYIGATYISDSGHTGLDYLDGITYSDANASANNAGNVEYTFHDIVGVNYKVWGSRGGGTESTSVIYPGRADGIWYGTGYETGIKAVKFTDYQGAAINRVDVSVYGRR